ncbi:hypothetical protein QEZ54_24905 [Catellatospora sp. KI3]|uniref:DUF3592 domain-containing protein n=1 Tax=Catellatospora sp. KI3 TaxID=3041620 RepID=UPI0024821787|nr:DUF3592 domain-containing protein [Catellatospora sp. KI3]MDI1464221.1 hypothetical protein [Catellatospora sp. KI3]
MADSASYGMGWSRRATGLGLALALLFGLAALVSYLTGRAEVEHLVDEGVPARATVFSVRDGKIDTFVVQYDYQGRTYTAELTGPIGTTLSVGEHPTVYLDPADPDLVVTADGLASRPGHWLPPVLALVAAVTAFVAISGRVSTLRRRRWTEARLDDLPSTPLKGRRRRGVVRRQDTIAWIMIGIVTAALPFAILTNPPGTALIIVGVHVPVAVAFYLLGPAGKIVITPRRLSLHTAFTVRHVPRHLVGGVDLADDDHIRVAVAGQRHLTMPMGAGAVWRHALNRRPAQLRAAAHVRALLDVVRAERTVGEVRTLPRVCTIALGLVSGAGFAAVAATVLSS